MPNVTSDPYHGRRRVLPVIRCPFCEFTYTPPCTRGDHAILIPDDPRAGLLVNFELAKGDLVVANMLRTSGGMPILDAKLLQVPHTCLGVHRDRAQPGESRAPSQPTLGGFDVLAMMRERLGTMGVVQSRTLKELSMISLTESGFYPAILNIVFDDGMMVRTEVNGLGLEAPNNGRSYLHYNAPRTTMTSETTPAPDTVRAWVHRMIDRGNLRAPESRGNFRVCYAPPTELAWSSHTNECNQLYEDLLAFRIQNAAPLRKEPKPVDPEPDVLTSPEKPITVRRWAHQVLSVVPSRAALCQPESGSPRDHMYVCDQLCETLTSFGQWWVEFTAANREANKDQQAQVKTGPCYPACGVPDHAPLDVATPAPAARGGVSDKEMRELAAQAYLNACYALKSAGNPMEKLTCADAMRITAEALRIIHDVFPH